MVRVYDEIVELIAAGTTSDSVAEYEPSQRVKDDFRSSSTLPDPALLGQN